MSLYVVSFLILDFLKLSCIVVTFLVHRFPWPWQRASFKRLNLIESFLCFCSHIFSACSVLLRIKDLRLCPNVRTSDSKNVKTVLNLSGSLLLMPTLRATSHHLVKVIYCSLQGDVNYRNTENVDGSFLYSGYCCSSSYNLLFLFYHYFG